MSEHLGLGKLIPEGSVQERDCIHIAVVPVVAGSMLRPGQKVGVMRASDGRYITGTNTEVVGVVGVIDPYLAVPVLTGQRCWLYLNPGSITSLRHDWTHPALEKAE